MTKVFLGIVGLILVLYAALALLPDAAIPAAQTISSTSTPSSVTKTIAQNLAIPWDVAFLPDGSFLVTERTGSLVHIRSDGSTRIPVSKKAPGEGGLLGIVLHPDFVKNKLVYLYISLPDGADTRNKVLRYEFSDDTLSAERTIIDDIPGATYHDGGRMEFGPDGKLYITTGDATHGAIAQDKNSLGGKILRLNDDGSIPVDNPFGSAVWSYGHRNPQGLAWDAHGNLWETEHGPTGEGGRCCHDELNLIIKGGNYGWPVVIGDEAKDGMILPIMHSGTDTWAPASLVYKDGSLYFGGLKGQAIFEVMLSGTSTAQLKTHAKNIYGRVRTLRFGPDGTLYITTSNTDGRGDPSAADDRLIGMNAAEIQ